MSRRLAIGLAVAWCSGALAAALESQAQPNRRVPRAAVLLEDNGDVLHYQDSILADPIMVPEKEKPPAGTQFLLGPPVYALGARVAVKFPLALGTVYDTAGKKVSADDVRKRLKPGDTVLVCPDGKMADAAYL